MDWRLPSAHELELQKEVTTPLKLLRTNAALRLKTVYAERLEYLVQERSERIDELTAQVDQLMGSRKACLFGSTFYHTFAGHPHSLEQRINKWRDHRVS